jgi:hypothetical protein
LQNAAPPFVECEQVHAVLVRYIQELKKKHSIEYDIHASYRLVEK